MKEQSVFINTFFTTNSTFTDEMALKLFPLVANEGTSFPFTTYRIQVQEGETKDADAASVTLSFYYDASGYNDCVTFTDKIENIIKNSNRFEWENSTVDFFDADQSFVGIINFKII